MLNKAKLVPGPMLHPHTPVRQRIIYNIKMDVSQVFYSCVAQNLGCGWGQAIQVQGDVLGGLVKRSTPTGELTYSPMAQLKQAEQSLLPKEPDVPAK